MKQHHVEHSVLRLLRCWLWIDNKLLYYCTKHKLYVYMYKATLFILVLRYLVFSFMCQRIGFVSHICSILHIYTVLNRIYVVLSLEQFTVDGHFCVLLYIYCYVQNLTIFIVSYYAMILISNFWWVWTVSQSNLCWSNGIFTSHLWP